MEGVFGIAGVHRLAQAVDAAVIAEPVVFPQRDDAIGEFGFRPARRLGRQGLAGGLLQFFEEGIGESDWFAAVAQIGQHRAGFDGSQLVFVAQ